MACLHPHADLRFVGPTLKCRLCDVSLKPPPRLFDADLWDGGQPDLERIKLACMDFGFIITDCEPDPGDGLVRVGLQLLREANSPLYFELTLSHNTCLLHYINSKEGKKEERSMGESNLKGNYMAALYCCFVNHFDK